MRTQATDPGLMRASRSRLVRRKSGQRLNLFAKGGIGEEASHSRNQRPAKTPPDGDPVDRMQGEAVLSFSLRTLACQIAHGPLVGVSRKECAQDGEYRGPCGGGQPFVPLLRPVEGIGRRREPNEGTRPDEHDMFPEDPCQSPAHAARRCQTSQFTGGVHEASRRVRARGGHTGAGA